MSYAATGTFAPDNTSDATFRLWGAGISAKLALMGLVQTADTGQINWTTVTRPLAANTVMGYEIWRFADALQATAPVYLKIEFGSGGVTLAPGVWITIGTASNGAGTLTGQLSTRAQISTANTSNATPTNCVFSGDTGRVGIAMYTNQSGCAQAWFIERTKDTAGADTAAGVLFMAFHGGTNPRLMQYIPASGSVPAIVIDSNFAPPFGVTSGAYGSDLAVYNNLHQLGGSYLNAGLAVVGYFNADISRDVTFTMTLYGSTHTLYPLGNTTSLSTVGRSGAALSLAMRYE